MIFGGIVSGFGPPGNTFTETEADRMSDPLVPVTTTLNRPVVLPPIVQVAT